MCTALVSLVLELRLCFLVYFFILFMLTLFNILCPVLHYFFFCAASSFFFVLSKEYYYTCREWGVHKSHREEGL